MPISQVLLSDTFGQFRNAFNDTANAVNSVVSTSGVISATTVTANTLTANTVTANTLTANTVTATNLTTGRVTLATTSGQLTDDSALTYDTATDILTLGGITDASSSTTGTFKVAGGVGIAKKLYVGTDLNVLGNSVFTGNVSFLGSNTLISTTVLNIEDNILQLSHLNPSDLVDIGFIGGYNNGANVHSGLFRDATDDTWKLFRNYSAEPSTTIDVSANGFAWANLAIGGLTAANSINIGTGQTYKINATDVLSSTTLGSGVTNSSLTSVGTIGTGVWQGTTIGTAYGGTGLTSFTANGVVYASSSSALATGSVLSFDGTNLGIGTNSPTAKLDITSASAGFSNIKLVQTGVRTWAIENTGTSGLFKIIEAGVSDRLVIDGSGNVGIGTSSPSSKLDVSGTITSTAISTGALTASGNVSFTSTGALKIPAGTTGERAGYATVGMIRYDTTLQRLEVYKSTGWESAGGGVSAAKLYFYANF